MCRPADFYPRSPCGERQFPARLVAKRRLFLSTLSLRRATASQTNLPGRISISIHALLAESDRLWTILYSCPGNFYPRSPCGERPGRRARRLVWLYFYPRSPCGERHGLPLRRQAVRTISIHALLAESDLEDVLQRAHGKNFYPRSPCGERRPAGRSGSHQAGISIHALLAESDNKPTQRAGWRQKFLSTLSLRRATRDCNDLNDHIEISIHALLAESDIFLGPSKSSARNFYPRSPCGERQLKYSASCHGSVFLSTLSLRRATLYKQCL